MEEKDITAEWFEPVVKKCLWINSSSDPVERVTNLIVEDAVPIGFNYSGRLLRLKACLQCRSGKEQQISVVLKSTPLNQDQSTFIAEHGLFILETMTYDKVLSIMERLLANHGINSELDWPRHYTISKQNMILLQDLKEMGYSCVRQREATYDEGILVVQAIGRLHAMSLILVNQGSLDTSEYFVNHMAENDTIVQFVYMSSLKALIDAIRVTKQQEWYTTADSIEANLSKIGPGLKALVKSSRGRNDVLNHGDCWLNNIMFKLPSNGDKPLAIKLIDFQLCYYNSLAWDLAHFMYCSYLADNREKFKPGLIKEYRSTLVNTLIQLKESSAIHKVPSEEMIEESLQELSLFGLMVGLATTPRLIPELVLNLDLDITLPDQAHQTRIVMYSTPKVFEKTTGDLQKLCNILVNLPN